jgi:hypothetical protein
MCLSNVGMVWFIIVFFVIMAVLAVFGTRRTRRTVEIATQPPPEAPPPGSEDAEWERQQREAWEREHPDWTDWERSQARPGTP